MVSQGSQDFFVINLKSLTALTGYIPEKKFHKRTHNDQPSFYYPQSIFHYPYGRVKKYFSPADNAPNQH
jgi:hypothetical protein